ncbi:hypothetical protein GCM10010399_54930 [Dactylosporangium fulvum]|uniref:Uncharacterized protein n=1 Tax=Dactylosporangium fulvum TaxID=53359 RepID=A0ABY5WCA2_9ACTN|nr:hypothetical protein [Dactylosporangium fulvum]UWP86669.1 hypothetical protein Dfulv_21490 [Dactylosporangium fulvum]
MLAPTPSTVAAPPFEPVAYLVDGARRLGSRARDAVAYPRVRLDPVLGGAIASAYMTAPSRDEGAFAAYAAFCAQTVRQYHFLVGRVEFGGLGVAVRIVDDDPYPDAEAMVEEVRRRRLRVFASAATGNPHPYLSDGENDMFRAVHDAFGHAASGRGFDPHGEEAAWLKHSAMYSPLARRALTTEVRGQTCAQLFHYGGGRFPEQKAVLLSRRFSDPRSVRVDGDVG